ncbi:MAG: hypothetical protein NVSMB1_19440 [Polyangiales bacterium]
MHFTHEEVEHAMETHLGGATATVSRGADQRPIGLMLHGGNLSHYGIHDGDILVGVNGMPVRTADEALAAVGALKAERHVVFTLLRGDRPFAIPVDIDGG